MRIGHGYDVHRFAENRKLILGGVKIDYEYGLLGHSDADVLIHAVCDALLGASALGDIGKHFPDTDERYKGIDSTLLLSHVVELISSLGYKVGNIDCTVIAQKPKIGKYVPEIAANISRLCKTEISNVNVKATTEEGLGFTGRLEGISAHAVCTIYND
ncbi:MAG: 2-C-methyl-D-erythritol 2,4-cyclodiphosphate synthase [Oscillospiraceae bacterium]|nr:2-C-methyl-D-erythritol 2,4-cyclodiphosphate synthase [Oscillospiraceae bacterium]MDY3938493.1 2-C-methyl-D-erythritol 2,4-cyclodiphosphate synthase [Oscillospiraceae bacterium]